MAWRAFSGLLDEWAWLDMTFDEWADARRALDTTLKQFETIECSDCQRQGTEALTRLWSAGAEGTEFRAEVDGHDYAIISV